ncbi:glycosyltransferase family 61 protein [Streptococcus equinus]|uniref:glycosyltransferase family 61 protein n=1 Tax=Streptococcus equinus TaxID=1335 RepID=UPI0004248D1E|nr:glycosyltransferase 61 family protein [Streptococcus equinus]
MNLIELDYLEELSKYDFEKLSKKNYLADKKLRVEEVSNGFVLPPKKLESRILNKLGLGQSLHGKGGVVDEFGNYVELSSQDAYGMKPRVKGAYKFSHQRIKFIDEEVVYMNYFIHQWGHFLLDVIGRLWYILKSNKKLKIVYTCYEGNQDFIKGNYLELLNLLGIDEKRLILVNEVTQFSKVIVPESSILPGKYYTREYKLIFNEIVKKSECVFEEEKNIYCSRSKLKVAKGKEFGESKIENIFVNNGFTPVYMEELSLKEQIALLNSSKYIVLTSGSLAHNLLFLKNKAKVIILNKTYRVNLHQFLINDFTDGIVTFVDVYVAPLPVLYGMGPFLFSCTEQFEKFLQNEKIYWKRETILSRTDFIKYYFKWLWLYKVYLFRVNSITEGDNEYEKSFREIRTHYRKMTGIRNE